MNIAFWLLAVILVVLLWLAMAPYFNQIGESFTTMLEEVQDALESEDKDK